jgi:hypothetical protein
VATVFASGGVEGILIIIYLAFVVLEIAALWQVFVKAGQPGWAAIIPIYNYYIILKIVGRPAWWLAFLLALIIPFVGWIAVFVIGIIVLIDLSKSYGKGSGFAVGLILLEPIFMPILGFGSSTYRGPSAGLGTGSGTGYPPPPSSSSY